MASRETLLIPSPAFDVLGNPKSTLVVARHTLFLVWLEVPRSSGICDPAHLLPNNTVDSISPDEDITLVRLPVFGGDLNATRDGLDALDSALEADAVLVLQLLV